MPFQSEVVQEQVTKLKGMVLLPAMKTGEGCGSEALAQEMGGCEPMTRRKVKSVKQSSEEKLFFYVGSEASGFELTTTTTKVFCDSGCAESAGANGMSRERGRWRGDEAAAAGPGLPGQVCPRGTAGRRRASCRRAL